MDVLAQTKLEMPQSTEQATARAAQRGISVVAVRQLAQRRQRIACVNVLLLVQDDQLAGNQPGDPATLR
ncbi:MAG: hypothetical protein M0T77_01955 [Actinomycetota bacterium]|nr:hypothetical protein [Actinomycetota bacterium]